MSYSFQLFSICFLSSCRHERQHKLHQLRVTTPKHTWPGTNQVKLGLVIISRPSPMITEPSHFAPTEQDLSRHWHFLHRWSEATLASQIGCFRDGAGAGAYRGISLYWLNSLVARPILGKTVVSGFRTLLCTLFCINRHVLSEIFLNLSKISCIYSLDRYALCIQGGIFCDTHVCLFIFTTSKQNIINTHSHWNIMFDMVLQTPPLELHHQKL